MTVQDSYFARPRAEERFVLSRREWPMSTTRVASPRWHLSGYDANLAFRYVDAYVWVDRPWLPGAAQFDLPRALLLAGSTPFP